MPNTTRGYPYPSVEDSVRPASRDFRDLALAVDQDVAATESRSQQRDQELSNRIETHTHDDRYYSKLPRTNDLLLDTFTRSGQLAGSTSDSGAVWASNQTLWVTDGSEATATGLASATAPVADDVYQAIWDLTVTTATPASLTLHVGSTADLWASVSVNSGGSCLVAVQKNLGGGGTTTIVPSFTVMTGSTSEPRPLRVGLSVLGTTVTVEAGGIIRSAELTPTEVAAINRSVAMQANNNIADTFHVQQLSVHGGGLPADDLAPREHTHQIDDVEGLSAALDAIPGHTHVIDDVTGLRQALDSSGGGESAYEIAVRNGFVGTEGQWLASLEGQDASNVLPDQEAVTGALGIHSANSYGADPAADWETNRDAFQAANDAAFLAGGGRVVATPGTYLVKGIIQDSGVEFYLPGVTLRSPDGQNPGVIRSRVHTTTGYGTGPTVTVQDAQHIRVGGLVAVEHAGVILDSQWTYLTTSIDDSQTTGIILKDRKDWRSWGVLRIGSELIRYSGFNATTGELTGVQRGVLGSTPTAHNTTQAIGVATHHIATVASVTGTTITLDTPLPQAVVDTTIHVGAITPALAHVTVDGNAPTSGATGSVSAVAYGIATRPTFHDLTITDSDHGGLMLYQGTTRASGTSVHLHNCGIPTVGKGSALWFYQGANNNTIVDLTITGDTYVAIYVDDRTSTGDPWDAAADYNTVIGLDIDTTEVGAGGPAAISVVASNYNKFLNITKIRGPRRGISVAQTHQGVTGDGTMPTSTGNEFGSGVIDVVGQPWGVLSEGNFLHDLWFTDRALENPVVADDNHIYAVRMRLGGNPIGPSFDNGSAAEPGLRFASDPDTGFFRYGEDIWAWAAGGRRRITMYGTQFKLEDGTHLEFGTGTGSRIGFTSTRKFAFWGQTPTTQPAAVPDTTGATVAELEAEVNKLKALLRQTGLMAN